MLLVRLTRTLYVLGSHEICGCLYNVRSVKFEQFVQTRGTVAAQRKLAVEAVFFG